MRDTPGAPLFQYSAREIGPPQLLIQQLRRAHSIFLLLHGFSLNAIYERVGRSAFCLFLDRFWNKFTRSWDLLLTGSPIVDAYNGIKLAAGGELGIGVGEEEWGSGEREVLEDFVTRIDGLSDLVVSRFGDPSSQDGISLADSIEESTWLGTETDPRPSDGVVFCGVNTLSSFSLANVSHWMEWIYKYGDAAYGIGRDPSSLRRRKPRKSRGGQLSSTRHSMDHQDIAQLSTLERSHTPGIPRPIVMGASQSILETERTPERSTGNSPPESDRKPVMPTFGTESVLKYVTLGYGSSWSLSARSHSPSPAGPPAETRKSSAAGHDQPTNALQPPPRNVGQSAVSQSPTTKTMSGHFILGPRDDLDILDDLEEESPASESDTGNTRPRIVYRTLHVRLKDASANTSLPKKLCAVIYVV